MRWFSFRMLVVNRNLMFTEPERDVVFRTPNSFRVFVHFYTYYNAEHTYAMCGNYVAATRPARP